jgi:PII-like signaling protein
MTFQTMCALRIYLRRGDGAPPKGFVQRFFRKPLTSHLLQEALKAGMTHASLHVGHMGFAKDAKAISLELSELPTVSLPACVELVGPKKLLEQFVQDQGKYLMDASLVMLEGVHVRPAIVEEDSTAAHPHHVEYVKAGASSLPIEHIDMDKDLPAASIAKDA